MIWLKNIFLVLLCVILGVAIGGGIFLVQSRYFPKATTASESKTANPSPTPTTNNYKSEMISFPLPKKVTVLEESLENKITQLSLLSQTSDTSVQSTGIKLFVSSKAGQSSAALTTAKAALRKRALAGLTIDSTKPTASSTVGGPTYYTTTGGASIAVYEPENTNALLLLTHDTSAGTQVSLEDFNVILTSLSTGKAVASPSAPPTTTPIPSTSTASPLLNMSL